jgi:hypothetical protein
VRDQNKKILYKAFKNTGTSGFLWPLQQFGSKTEHVYNFLAFAALWKWNL